MNEKKRVEVGGFFEYPDYAVNDEYDSILKHITNGFGNEELRCNFIRDGRQAITSVLISRERDIKKRTCYLPAYLCSSMLLPFTERRLQVKFYPHQYPLRPKIDLGVKDSLFFINDAFGVPMLSQREIQELEDNGNIIILDTSHSILDQSRFIPHGSDFFIIASLRKMFPIPDGAVVFSTDPQFHPTLTTPFGWEQMLEAMFLKKFYLTTKSFHDATFIKDYFLNLNRIYNETKNQIPGNLVAIPDISLHILNGLSLSVISEQRRINLSYVYENISNEHRLFQPNDITSPYFAPILFSDTEKRDQFSAGCIQRDLFPTVLWPIPPEVPKSFKYEHDLSSRFLSIPIDQRYNPQSYDVVSDLFEAIKE